MRSADRQRDGCRDERNENNTVNQSHVCSTLPETHVIKLTLLISITLTSAALAQSNASAPAIPQRLTLQQAEQLLIERNLAVTAAKYQIDNVYTSYTEMLDREQLDLVSVCTPNMFHADISVYALNGFCAALAGVVATFQMTSGNPAAGAGFELDVIASVVMGGTLLSGGVGTVAGTLAGVLIFGTIQSAILFDGRLNSWWARIVVGLLLLFFILFQRFLTRTSPPSVQNDVPITTQQKSQPA